MRYILGALLLACISCSAQTILRPATENIDADKFIGSMVKFHTYKFNDNIINIVINSNDAGSASADGSGEVTYNLYIAKCEYDELPDCQLFSFKDKYSLEIIKVEEKDSNYAITVKYGGYKNKHQEVLLVTK